MVFLAQDVSPSSGDKPLPLHSESVSFWWVTLTSKMKGRRVTRTSVVCLCMRCNSRVFVGMSGRRSSPSLVVAEASAHWAGAAGCPLATSMESHVERDANSEGSRAAWWTLYVQDNVWRQPIYFKP